jgi:hypothetical protein
LEATVAMVLPQSLDLLTLQYPASEIRAAIGDDAALASIALDPAERYLLVWRQDARALLRPVSIPSGRFLQALLAGTPAQDALTAASSDPVTTLAQLQAEIFAAPFCSIIPNPERDQS